MFITTTMDMQAVYEASHLSLDVNNNENLELNLERNEKYSLRQRYKRAVAVNQTPSPDPYGSSSRTNSSRQSATTKQRSRAQPRPPKKNKPFLSVDDLHLPHSLSSPLSPSSSSVTSSSSQSSYGHFDTAKPTKEKPKSKAPPLSKYRRKTANARERTRMREINSAFETLRKCVPMTMCLTKPASSFDPLYLTTHQAPGSQVQVMTPGNEKLTKITTLKVAMKYIRMLNEVLNGSMPMGESGSGDIAQSEVVMDNNNNSLKTSQLSIKVPPTQHKKTERKNTNLLMTTTTARGGCKTAAVRVKSSLITAATQPMTMPPTSSTSSNCSLSPMPTNYNPFLTSGGDMLFGSPCLTPPIEDCSSDLAMLLDGSCDEDSLRLSESCLSPPLSEQNIKVSFNADLELGFLLESDSDTLQLSEPCLSPLSSALDPFGDLLSSGFNEQTVFDMYL